MQDHWQDAAVVREDGISGKVVTVTSSTAGSTLLVIEFADGSRVAVAPQMLAAQPDGVCRLLLAPSRLNPEDEVVIPVIAEELAVSKRQGARGGVRVIKRVETHEAALETATVTETVSVERVPINALLEGDAPQIREEDGVIVIPVLEEVLVVEKRLLLREEVRVAKHASTSTSPQRHTLRQETVEVERLAPEELAQQGHTTAGDTEFGARPNQGPPTEQRDV